MDARDYLVFDALTRELAASAARRDAFHFRRPRFRRRLLGSAVGYFRLTNSLRSEFDALLAPLRTATLVAIQSTRAIPHRTVLYAAYPLRSIPSRLLSLCFLCLTF